MITLRCTRKLLDRAGVPARVDTKPPTTVLGDWYANLMRKYGLRIANGCFSLFNVCSKWLLPILATDGFGSNSVKRGIFYAMSALQSATTMDATRQ